MSAGTPIPSARAVSAPRNEELAAPLSARDRILVTAHDLFYRDGLRATGVDRLIAESGVAKLTFYRHFPSKEALIRTFLAYRHERWMAWFIDALGRYGAEAGGGLGPLRRAMAEWFGDPAYRGCAFINAVAEIGGSLPDVHDIARRHKLEMQEVIAELLTAPHAGLPPGHDPRAQAAALAVDGAIVRAQMDGPAAALAGLGCLLDALEPAAAGARAEAQSPPTAAGAPATVATTPADMRGPPVAGRE